MSAPRFEPVSTLTAADVDDALQLSTTAGWNQTADDWRTMLALGQGWGMRAQLPDGARPLAASTVVLPYQGFAWISMVLVLPGFRRLGLATRLLQCALDHLAGQRLTPILDATPAGHAVYRQQGFQDTWGFTRWRRDAGACGAQALAEVPAAPVAVTRGLGDGDWPAVAALDAPAFGADRLPLLQSLARRAPAAARVALDGEGRICGFVLARDGREAGQVGPLLAPNSSCAQALLDAALAAMPGAVYVDLCDRQQPLQAVLQARGFVLQRPFTRMVHAAGLGVPAAPGDPASVFLVAGPELG